MASISEILMQEDKNQGSIYLYSEGLFWQSYQQSAFRFIKVYDKYKINKKYFKGVNRDVVFLGFPKTVLNRLFEQEDVTGLSEDKLQIKIKSPNTFEETEYALWFDSIAGTSKKETTALDSDENFSLDNKEKKIIQQIHDYRIEKASPVDCMLFIISIQKELDNNV